MSTSMWTCLAIVISWLRSFVSALDGNSTMRWSPRSRLSKSNCRMVMSLDISSRRFLRRSMGLGGLAKSTLVFPPLAVRHHQLYQVAVARQGSATYGCYAQAGMDSGLMRLETASTKETDIGLAEIDYRISIIGNFPDESRKGWFISGNPNGCSASAPICQRSKQGGHSGTEG